MITQKNNYLLNDFRREMQSVLEAFTTVTQKIVDEEVQPTATTDYLTRRKGFDRKEQQHFTKTKKEELPFECI